jgi:hypothetical protein
VLERINFPRKKREAVLHAIRVHDVGAAPEDRTTLESKILYDADKIDTLGVVGVLRYIRHFCGKNPLTMCSMILMPGGRVLPFQRRGTWLSRTTGTSKTILHSSRRSWAARDGEVLTFQLTRMSTGRSSGPPSGRGEKGHSARF